MPVLTANRRRAAGFTIVELMFTVFIAAVLMAIAVPSFRTMMTQNRLATQTNDLIGAANYARSEAITRNRNVSLCKADTATAVACSTGTGNWSFWIVLNSDGTVVRTGTINTYGNTLRVSTTLTNNAVTFGADGLARTGTGLVANHTITVCSTVSLPENIRTITMGAGSRLSTARTTGTCP